MTLPVIHRVTSLDLKVQPWSWPFAEMRRAEIDAHFAGEQAKRPELWNGRVLVGRNPAFADGCFRAECFEIDFASFLSWRDWGFPDPSVFNGFGMGALLANDGAFVLGEMADHTANGGRLYFPSGTPDPGDIRGGMLDIAASIAREMEEETGLTPADYRADPYWDCVVSGVSVAIMQRLHVDLSGEELRARIEANLARQPQPELARIHLVRSSGDFTAAMPRFVTAYLEQQLDIQEGRRP
ncbi:MAG TPA: NUDIX hydrolase [Bradyrhizobium sp.]|nr:NUDIX hydrolase [Bradyrhizobium sp.]